ncbi:hypothetical protein BDV06DRAFT_216705 [Aspergillus oleicola]
MTQSQPLWDEQSEQSKPTCAGRYGESQPNRKSADAAVSGELMRKEIQLFPVGGANGTSLYVQIRASLPKGGPAGLFLGFVLYETIVLAVNQCFGTPSVSEMVTYMPIASSFVRLAGFCVDAALSFALGWNHFFLMAFNILYEITAIHVLLTYWTDKVHVGAVCVLNGFMAKYFVISEFYMSIFKIFLMLGLMMYTFITMGAFVEDLVPGDTGRFLFLGLLSCMIQGSFTMVGPEFISMAAGEAENFGRLMGKAFSSFVWRLMFFFIDGTLCVGIVIPYNDEMRVDIISDDREGSGTGAAFKYSSSYVILMIKFGIKGIPNLVNALIMTSVLSAGSVIFSAARTLHGMALDGKAPSFLARCNRYGLPFYAVTIALLFCFVSPQQIGNTSSIVLSWFVGICTASYLLNYFGTPYAAWYALVGTFLMALVLGYTVFIEEQWDTTMFFTSYTMVGFFVVASVGWKVVRRTRYVRIGEADLKLGTTKDEIDLYEALYEKPRRGRVLGWLNG